MFSARGNDADAVMSDETYQRKKKGNKTFIILPPLLIISQAEH
jgi:hypothetical protein